MFSPFICYQILKPVIPAYKKRTVKEIYYLKLIFYRLIAVEKGEPFCSKNTKKKPLFFEYETNLTFE